MDVPTKKVWEPVEFPFNKRVLFYCLYQFVQSTQKKIMNEIVKLRKRRKIFVWKWAQHREQQVLENNKSFYHHYENFLFLLSSSFSSTLKYSKQKTKFIMFRLLLLLMCLRQERFFFFSFFLHVYINLVPKRREN